MIKLIKQIFAIYKSLIDCWHIIYWIKSDYSRRMEEVAKSTAVNQGLRPSIWLIKFSRVRQTACVINKCKNLWGNTSPTFRTLYYLHFVFYSFLDIWDYQGVLRCRTNGRRSYRIRLSFNGRDLGYFACKCQRHRKKEFECAVEIRSDAHNKLINISSRI